MSCTSDAATHFPLFHGQRCFIPFIGSAFNTIRQHMLDTRAWYKRHNEAHGVYRARRRTRPLPPERYYAGRGTTDDPLQLDYDASSNVGSLHNPVDEHLNVQAYTVQDPISLAEDAQAQSQDIAGTVSHDNSIPGYHNSIAVLNVMEQFLEQHFEWWMNNHMPTREAFPDQPVWRKVTASQATCSCDCTCF